MEKNDLLRYGEGIVRILEVQQDKVLIIDCIKRNMPVWIESSKLDSNIECMSEKLASITDINCLDVSQRKIMYKRYTMIAPVLPFIADEKMRSRLICSISKEYQIQKVLLGSRCGFSVVCQLAFFLGMELEQITAPLLTAEQIQQEQSSHYMKGTAPCRLGTAGY